MDDARPTSPCSSGRCASPRWSARCAPRLRARRRQYELRGLLDGLREADQRKTEFLATLAHELRNPLAPISTALSLLQRKTPSPTRPGPYCEMMERQVEHMVRLVDDLMEVSRITRGKIELQSEPVLLDRGDRRRGRDRAGR